MEVLCLVNDKSLAKVTYSFLFNFPDLLSHLYLSSSLSSQLSENYLSQDHAYLKSEESQDQD